MNQPLFVDIQSPGEMKVEDLGGKGFGLWRMTQDGLRVPPALVIPTYWCGEYKDDPKGVRAQLKLGVQTIREHFTKQMGYMPLLSIRSGARVSMPGMMDTILNVGLDPETLGFWKNLLGDTCTEDSYCRLIEMYGSVVNGIDRGDFEDLPLADRLETYKAHMGEDFPATEEQIVGAIEAVFASWDNERAKIYRKLNGIPEEWGTAVVVQAMVFGNLNDKSATGVLFTRNPDTGLAKITGEFLVNAQGEDVVAGIKTPQPLEEMDSWNPEVYAELCKTVLTLEEQRKDMQDVEFTIQDGVLYFLQTRNAKRSATAAMVIALDMLKEGVLTEEEAVARVSREQYAMLQQPILSPKFKAPARWTGIAACSGVATGVVVKSAQAAINCTKPCILVTEETTPDDIGGMVAAKGVITMHGGSTSHAAVVARGMNKPCIVGIGAKLSEFADGQTISIDGASGRIWTGEVLVIDNSESEELKAFNALMMKVSKAQLISTDPTKEVPVLDVTVDLYDTTKVIEKVTTRLKKSGDFIVDMMVPDSSPETRFLSIFCDAMKQQQKVVALIDAMPDVDRNRITVLASVPSKKTKSIMQVKTLEHLIMANGKFVWAASGIDDKVLAKVMAWKTAEGCSMIDFGNPEVPEPFLSEEQVIATLLR